jgi:aspartate-semialdehyde dehydrogenase
LRDACEWLVPTPRPAAAELLVRALGSEVESTLCFSALETGVAREAEERLARSGQFIVSNASAWRMDPRVPLVVPEVNAAHLSLLACQVEWPGALLTNPNCASIGLSLALAPLERRFGLAGVSVVTLQALSGAGIPGLRTLECLANVVPHIQGEVEKLERETLEILGSLRGTPGAGDLRVEPARFDLGAQCNRVPVADGHTLCVTVRLREGARREELLEAWRSFSGAPQELELPSAPNPVVHVHEQPAAPQPARHASAGGGMAIHVGCVRGRSSQEWQFTTLSHNTVRGAAGGAVLTAELLTSEGFIQAK